jgi:hypothetical protein
MQLPLRRPRWQLSVLVEAGGPPLPVLDRASGFPLGLPQRLWPLCGECRAAMTFVGQFADLASSGRVIYAFLCTNPQTSLRCQRWVVEPGQQHVARAVVAEPTRLEQFTAPPSPLPVLPGPGLVAAGWDIEDDEVPNAIAESLIHGLHTTRPSFPVEASHDADPDDPARDDLRERRALDARTKIGGVPTWLQDPFFQTDPENAKRYRYRAQWSDWDFAAGGFFELPWVVAEIARAGRNGSRYVDSQQELQGRSVAVRAFADASYVLLDDAMIRKQDRGVLLMTSLGSGRLYLLEDSVGGGYALYYIGR